MFTTIEQFMKEYENEAAGTLRILDALTDESLRQQVTPVGRTLGRLAAHIIVEPHEMLSRTGLVFESPLGYEEVPAQAAALVQAYRRGQKAMTDAIRSQWSDASLADVHDMYGMQWTNAFTLRLLIQHEIHHRAQMTVLMRQAGLRVPGLYGPAMEDWAAMGRTPPVV